MRINGLKSGDHTKYNGKNGAIMGFDPATGRYSVNLGLTLLFHEWGPVMECIFYCLLHFESQVKCRMYPKSTPASVLVAFSCGATLPLGRFSLGTWALRKVVILSDKAVGLAAEGATILLLREDNVELHPDQPGPQGNPSEPFGLLPFVQCAASRSIPVACGGTRTAFAVQSTRVQGLSVTKWAMAMRLFCWAQVRPSESSMR